MVNDENEDSESSDISYGIVDENGKKMLRYAYEISY
jgi:hypothetical protein